jgi:hypothetical protein
MIIQLYSIDPSRPTHTEPYISHHIYADFKTPEKSPSYAPSAGSHLEGNPHIYYLTKYVRLDVLMRHERYDLLFELGS